jgi:hypothetical protein
MSAFALSVSDSCHSNQVSRITFLKLADFAAFIRNQPPVTDKLASKGIVAALFNGNIRLVENINSVTSATLDFDEPEEGLFEAVTAVLEGEGIGFVAFGTWSNNGRFAVVIPFAEPTSIAGHAATIQYVHGLLGAYAKFAPESMRAAQLRFISGNADAEYRLFKLNDAPLLKPRVPVDEPLPAAQHVATFDGFADMASPAEQQLFLLSLRHGLINPSRLDAYEHWSAVLFAAFRAWGVGKKRKDLNQHQLELVEALNQWSARHEKYKPGCVDAKVGDHLTHGAKTLSIQSLLRMEVDHGRLRHFIGTDESLNTEERVALAASLNRLLGGTSVTQVTHINEEAVKEAQTERAAELAKREADRKWGQGILQRMPAPTPRFAQFREIITALATQGSAEHWELPENDWPKDFFLRPIPFIFSLAQVATLGFMPHVIFRYGEGRSPKALNLYFLHLAAPGTGKTETFKSVHPIIENTIFRYCNPREKLHSATGLWVNHFQRTGSLQLMTSEEAESLFVGSGADQHLLNLHTAIKELFDKGIPGQPYRPSAQVQREIAEVMAPCLHLNLAGTLRLLNGNITQTQMGDGFTSRFCVYLNDADPSTRTEAECIDAKLAQMQSTAERGTDANVLRAVEFFKKLWKDSHHPAGNHIFDIPVNEQEELIEMIQAHFNNPDIKPRYIRPGKSVQDMKHAAEVFLRAEKRYPLPRSLNGLPEAEGISSLGNRAEVKLSVLATALTLISDPNAEYLNLEILEWAEEVLWVAQRDFYYHLIGAGASFTSILPKYRVNPEALAKLRPAIEPGGLLYAGGLVKSSDMRASSKAWRSLLSDLKTDPNGERCRLAHEMLIELGVAYQDTGANNSRMFFIKPETKED